MWAMALAPDEEMLLRELKWVLRESSAGEWEADRKRARLTDCHSPRMVYLIEFMEEPALRAS